MGAHGREEVKGRGGSNPQNRLPQGGLSSKGVGGRRVTETDFAAPPSREAWKTRPEAGREAEILPRQQLPSWILARLGTPLPTLSPGRPHRTSRAALEEPRPSTPRPDHAPRLGGHATRRFLGPGTRKNGFACCRVNGMSPRRLRPRE